MVGPAWRLCSELVQQGYPCSEGVRTNLTHKGKHSNDKEVYSDGSKSTERKVDFAAVFVDITRRGALPEEVSINTAETTAM